MHWLNVLTAYRLREVLRYDPETGLAYWLTGTASYPPGRLATKPFFRQGKKDHISLTIDGKSYTMGRLAFLYMTGEWPKHLAEHWDGDKHNNKWSNLRDATRQQNAVKIGPKVKGMPKGVVYIGPPKDVYEARIFVNGKSELIGEFMCREDAGAAYDKRAREVHGEFAYVSQPSDIVIAVEPDERQIHHRGRRILFATQG